MVTYNTIDSNQYWLISDDNDKDGYYLNTFLFCSKCRSSIHIINVNILDNESIKYKCKCGTYNKKLDEVLELFTFQMQKSDHFNDGYKFGKKENKVYFSLDNSIPNCQHGNKSISFCHFCSEYLCHNCLSNHISHLCYREDLIPDNHSLNFENFMNSLSFNYKIIINQIDEAINQLVNDKKNLETYYNKSVKVNEKINSLTKRLKNNYLLTKKTNFINYLNFYNFSHPNEIYKIREILSPQNIHNETLTFIDYLKNNCFIFLNPRISGELHYIRTIVKKEENDQKKIKEGKEYHENYEDNGIGQTLPYASGEKQIDDYGYTFDINVQNIEKKNNIVKYDEFDDLCITIPNDENTKMKFFLLPDNKFAIFYYNILKPKIDIFSLYNYKLELTIPIKEKWNRNYRGWQFNPYKPDFYCLSNGTFLYYYGCWIKRIIINSHKYYTENNSLSKFKIMLFTELSNDLLLFQAKNNVSFLVQNSFPFKIKTKFRMSYFSVCQISLNTFIFCSPKKNAEDRLYSCTSKVVQGPLNHVIKEFEDLEFDEGYKMEKTNKILLASQSTISISILNINTLEIETVIMGYEIIKIYTEIDNKEYVVCFNSDEEYFIWDLVSFKIQKLSFCPEQKDIRYIFPLKGHKFLIDSLITVKVFGY